MKHINALIKKIFYKHRSQPLRELVRNAGDHSHETLYYKVPYIAQVHGNMCTDASEAMLNKFFSDQTNINLTKNPRGVMEGRAFSEKQFVTGNVDIDKLKLALNERGPMLLSLPMKFGLEHTVVCIGYSNNHIIYHDPMHKTRCITLSELKRITSEQALEVGYYSKFDNPDKQTIITSSQEKSLMKLPISFARLPVNDNFFGNAITEKEACKLIIKFLEEYTTLKSHFFLNFPLKRKINAFVNDHKKVVMENKMQLAQLVEAIQASFSDQLKPSPRAVQS